MANTLKGRHGVVLYSAQSVLGTAVTPATAAGAGSFDATVDSGMNEVRTLGQATPLVLKPGVAITKARFQIDALQTSALLIQCARASGVLPYLTFGFGYTQDDASHFAWQVQDCKVDSFDLSLDAGGLAKASLTITGGLETDLTTLVAANLAPTPMYSYEAVIQKAGSAYPVDVKSFRLQVNHNVAVENVIPSVAPSTFKRGWKYLTEGDQKISGSIVAYAKSGVNMHADTEATFTLSLTMTDIVGGMSPNTITLSLTGCKYVSEQMGAKVSGDLMFTTPFLASTFSIA